MAVFNVHMLAHNPPGWLNPRPVQVPDERVSGNVLALLEDIFYWGQNDFQPLQCCSVSMGDVAEVNGKFYMCKAAGWDEISSEDLEKYKNLPQRERVWSEFVRMA